ncbi:hypothetical protein SAMN05421666_1027 [Roseovarius nanhaiticus]|uniref:Uncharacterized protein n=1 Tax=Roseovarius nanhaiticus TaxID=573024 RepID=A0A1N7FGS7_9RHOB|nr:hypothetical protein [Roseovarius nanhaiticus]SEK54888.1 hypothetical protein SAMN05216208_1109 [Roseovarius nanhaiticus]SIR99490.1 hypothetical protein SAMN05421666_1027 [Roseovarius nanhaiticus]
MAEDHKSFMNIINNSPSCAERWAGLTEKAIADARAHGVTLEPDDCLNIREIRLAAMGAELDSEAYQNELLNLPQLSMAARKKAIQEGDSDIRAAALSDLNRWRENEHFSHRTAHAARRLSEARELGIATPAPAQDELSRNDRLEMLKEVKDPAERLALARKWNLIK